MMVHHTITRYRALTWIFFARILRAMPLQISGKDLGALAMRDFCPRCFWIQRRTKLPWQIFPGIFSSIDSYSKKVVHGQFDKSGMPGWLG